MTLYGAGQKFHKKSWGESQRREGMYPPCNTIPEGENGRLTYPVVSLYL